MDPQETCSQSSYCRNDEIEANGDFPEIKANLSQNWDRNLSIPSPGLDLTHLTS